MTARAAKGSYPYLTHRTVAEVRADAIQDRLNSHAQWCADRLAVARQWRADRDAQASFIEGAPE